jgi:hypothetical protein
MVMAMAMVVSIPSFALFKTSYRTETLGQLQ